MSKTSEPREAEPLLAIDRAAQRAFKPWRKRPTAKALAWFGQAGDQLQLRILIGGVCAAALFRGDPRLLRASARMLAAHELATLAKGLIKGRIDRRRPRNAARDVRPHRGHSRAKKLSSFPSGHSAGSAAVASAFASAYPAHGMPAVAAAGAVSAVQVPTAAHYPSDVVAGFAIGIAANAIIGVFTRLWRGTGRHGPS